MKIIFLFVLSVFTMQGMAQQNGKQHIKVLFIGNSYVFFNNLPQICAGIAASMGDVLITDQSTVGGYSLQQHFADSNTIRKIKAGIPDYNTQERGSWDYVVLQERSQLPSYPIREVERLVFPYAHALDSTIHQHHPHAKTIFYVTWGRKNGDKARCRTWPPVCTYQGMDSLLALRYGMMAEKERAMLAPVSAVWKYLRENSPAIELYNADESHPSEAGSYLAACSFYTVLFKKDPMRIQFDYKLDPLTALTIRKAVKEVIYQSLQL